MCRCERKDFKRNKERTDDKKVNILTWLKTIIERDAEDRADGMVYERGRE